MQIEAARQGRWEVMQTDQTTEPQRSAKTRKQDAGVKVSAADGFSHTEYVEDPYTTYGGCGQYTSDSGRALPDRYYDGSVAGNVYYKGGTISYIGLLEEAVQNGDVILDESKNVWENVRNAEHALIDAKARPLYPWSSKLYSEDGQYVFRVENGEITGATRAFYYDENGKKITTQYIAEQLAAGVLPSEVDGDYSFLAFTDPELYDRALEIGSAKRYFDDLEVAYKSGNMKEEDFLDAIHPILLLLRGRDDGLPGYKALKELLENENAGKLILESYGEKPPDEAESAPQLAY